MGFRFGPCCCEGCEILADTFDRADSTSLGSDWNERVGALEILSNKLKATASSSLAICNTAHPTPSHTGYIYATINAATSGDNVRIIFDYVDDSNYHFAELLVHTTTPTLAIYKRTAGANTLIGSASSFASVGASADHAFSVCLQDNNVAVRVGGNYRLQSITPHGGDQVGLGTGTISTAVTFNDFYYGQSHTTNEDCQQCAGPCDNCEDNEAPLEIELTIADLAFANPNCTECADLNTTFILALEDGTGCAWRYTFPGSGYDICSGAPGGDVTHIRATLAFNGSDYILTVQASPFVLGLEWKVNLGAGPIACRSWANVDVPAVGNDFTCGVSTSSATITAIGIP